VDVENGTGNLTLGRLSSGWYS